MGGGSTHGGTYVDPLSSPVRFLGLGLQRLPMLLATALVGLPVALLTRHVWPVPLRLTVGEKRRLAWAPGPMGFL